MDLTRLKEVLEAREARVEKQCGLLCDGGVLVSFSLNIPGPVKNAVLYRYVFETGLAEIRRALSGLSDPAVKEEAGESAAGPYAFFLLPEGTAAQKIKRMMITVEEASPLGRLYDIDVLYRTVAAPSENKAAAKDTAAGNTGAAGGRCYPVKVSRTELGFPARTCLICGSPAFVCVRAARHEVPEVLMAVIDRILSSEEIHRKLFAEETFRESAADLLPEDDAERAGKGGNAGRGGNAGTEDFAERVAVEALRAILYEVTVTPKPGLVDTENNGAHRDMNITTFFDSAAALTHYFKECVLEGIRRAGEPEEKLLPHLRPLGIRAEEEMYRATFGVNTHKGAIFTLGLFCAAAGILHARGAAEAAKIRQIPLFAGKIASSMENGSRGVRAEAMNGYPSLRQAMKEVHTEESRTGSMGTAEDRNRRLNEAGVRLLLKLISLLDDSNAVRRRGEEAAEMLRERAEAVLMTSEDADTLFRNAAELDRELIRENISPGGAADLLAAGFFLQFLEKLHKSGEI